MRALLNRDIDIGFEGTGTIHGGEEGGGLDAVADADRNVANDPRAGRDHLIVVQLHLLLPDVGAEGLKLRLGCIEGGTRLVKILAAHHSGIC